MHVTSPVARQRRESLQNGWQFKAVQTRRYLENAAGLVEKNNSEDPTVDDSVPTTNSSCISIVQNVSSSSRPLSACDRALSVLRDIRSGRSTTNPASRIEQNKCFEPYLDRKGKGKKRSGTSGPNPSVKKSFKEPREVCSSFQFVCLANRNQTKVPTPTEKSLLMTHGMGEKVVRFPSLDLGYRKVMEILIDAFPKLAHGGGCDFLKCLPNSRDLVTIPLQMYAASPILVQLQGKAGSGRVYLRPIQRDLPWDADMPLNPLDDTTPVS